MSISKRAGGGLALLTALFLVVSPAMADKPEWAGRPHEKKQDKQYDRLHHGEQTRHGAYFTVRQREDVADYYHGRYSGKKKCPPGLAKKQQGCMPPGQARQWELNKPLGQGVVYYNVPHQLSVKIGVPPAGHRYVRVGADILLIAVGTNMVVDAITDILHR